jgi:recombinational DNA repair protein (RecF pathway)
MRGYILSINKVRDEDMIVTILTTDSVVKAYRFYGARHSSINVGYKIDFELEESIKVTIPRLKEVLHVGYEWILDSTKLYHWQQFIQLLSKHLRDVDECDEFYYYMLESLESNISMQNAKRAIIERYVTLLEYEGRLHTDYRCFVCENEINTHVSLARSYLPAHQKCISVRAFESYKIQELFESKSTFLFDDEDIDRLWDILTDGI